MPIPFVIFTGSSARDHVTFCLVPIVHTVPVTGDVIVGSHTSRGVSIIGPANANCVRLTSSPKTKSIAVESDLKYMLEVVKEVVLEVVQEVVGLIEGKVVCVFDAGYH